MVDWAEHRYAGLQSKQNSALVALCLNRYCQLTDSRTLMRYG